MKAFYLALFSFCMTCLNAQVQIAPKKNLQALRISEKISLDANLNEPAWQNAQNAEGFVYLWPDPGKPSSQKTIVKVLYDDNSLYIGAFCYDNSPDSIFHRITKRDELDNSDDFGVIIDTYMDGQNAVLFGVSPDNVQSDVKFSLANANPNEGNNDGEDPAWDAVWRSSAQIVKDGWIAEIEIPYSALRFPKKSEQKWSINFYRTIRRKGETDSWNEVKAQIAGSLSQMGILEGVRNIKAPLRLSATPFVAAYANNRYNTGQKTTWDNPYTFGMDLKYGINQAFTLDATLIPDFGQVRTDNFVLNLSPFEQRFNENRPFFTEGTELFNKGGLFYSRRIGARPMHFYGVYDQLNDTEEITNNPQRVQLINATKISGRTNAGLGLGFFNAVESATFATVEDKETGGQRQVETSPLTNKSIFVFDQNLKNNSSITLINTNVMREGPDRDANVTGFLFNLKNKAQSYSLKGNANYSTRKTPTETEDGFAANIELNKTSGNFTFGTSYNLESDKYNPNDLGLLFSPNESTGLGWVNLSRYKPWWKLNSMWSSAWAYNSMLYKPAGKWTETSFGLNAGGNTKTFHNFGMNLNGSPWGEHDYFEPRTFDFISFYKIPANIGGNFWYNSDNRKRFTVSINGSARTFDETNRKSTYVSAFARCRMTAKFSLGLGIDRLTRRNNVGWIAPVADAIGYNELTDNDIVLGRRDILGFDNFLELNYSFNTRMNLSMFVRHYWQRVEYNSFGKLMPDGNLSATVYTGKDSNNTPLNDIEANYFNIDLIYTWRFAPGSDLLLVYKNGIYHEEYQNTGHNYFYGAQNLPNFEGSNSLSIKILYFLDYESVKKMNIRVRP